MKSYSICAFSRNLVSLLAACGLWLAGGMVQAAPQLVSTVPANLAAGVSPGTTIVFTFSEPMDPDPEVTWVMVMVMAGSLPQQVPVTSSWSGGNTVLTCTPLTLLPANAQVIWAIEGATPDGDPLEQAAGMFTTASTSTGCDPAAPMLSLTVSKGWLYSQTSDAAPTLALNQPYCFLACLTLPCPREATNVSLHVPNTGARPNLGVTAIPGHLTHLECSAIEALNEAAYPYGDYVFDIRAVASNQSITVSFPSTLSQPAAPHLANYAAAQAINPALPFVLEWDPFAGGTAADLVYVEIYGGVFKTPMVGEPGKLDGTATSVVIPANTFEPDRVYSGCLSFYRYQMVTNGTSHVSLAYRSSTTEFSLKTAAGTSISLILTNAARLSDKVFSFEVLCPIGRPLIAEWSSNLLPGQWQTLSQTTSPTTCVRFTDPRAVTNTHFFYRVRTGP